MADASLPFRFCALSDQQSDPARARVVVLPVPYDATASYRAGARHGPEAIIDASRHMELFDEEERADFTDVGIATVAPLCVDARGPEHMVAAVERAAIEVVKRGQFLLTLGGEHTITLGALRAIRAHYPDAGVLQLDAHLDLRDSYEGSPYSHACVMRRVREDLGLEVAQIGIRSFSAEEHAYVKEKEIKFVPARALAQVSSLRRDRLIDSIVAGLPEQVYITVDLDVFDPAVLPATGTPEPGGLDWYTGLELVRRVASARHLVGADIVELAPIPGQPASDFLAAKLAYKLIGYAVALERRWVWKTDPESRPADARQTTPSFEPPTVETRSARSGPGERSDRHGREAKRRR